MARKPFTVSYPDGSKKNIGATERAQMELRGEILQTGSWSFAFTGVFVSKPFKCNDFSGLSVLVPDIEQRIAVKRQFLPGYFVIEYPLRLGGKKVGELLERPEYLAKRFAVPVAGFEAAA